MADADVINTIIAEALGDGDPGMTAVAYVIANRAALGGMTPAEVVRKEGQFAGYSNPGEVVKKSQSDPAVIKRVTKIWEDVVNGRVPDPTSGGTMFHASRMTPGWATAENKHGTVKVGGQTFYKGGASLPKADVGLPAKDDPWAGLNVVDLTAGGQTVRGRAIPPNPYAGKKRKEDIQGVVFHHTGGSGLEGAMTAGQQKGIQRGTGAQFYIDTDGQIYRYGGDNSLVAHIRSPTDKYRTDAGMPTAGLSNQNTIGIEIVGADSSKFTQAQRLAAAKLTGVLQKQYGIQPQMMVGHGALQGGEGGNKMASEGISAQEFVYGSLYPKPKTMSGLTAAKRMTEPLPSPSASSRLPPIPGSSFAPRLVGNTAFTEMGVPDPVTGMDRGYGANNPGSTGGLGALLGRPVPMVPNIPPQAGPARGGVAERALPNTPLPSRAVAPQPRPYSTRPLPPLPTSIPQTEAERIWAGTNFGSPRDMPGVVGPQFGDIAALMGRPPQVPLMRAPIPAPFTQAQMARSRTPAYPPPLRITVAGARPIPQPPRVQQASLLERLTGTANAGGFNNSGGGGSLI